MSKYITIILIIIFFTGCRKEIDLNIPPVSKKVVVEGYIENGEYSWVGLTYSQPYLEPIDLSGFNTDAEYIDKLSAFFVLNALVTVSNGIEIDTLKFGVSPIVLNGGATYPPLRYMGRKIKGEIGDSYELKISIGDVSYASVTTITKPIVADSIFFKPDINSDSLGSINAFITDDGSTVDYYSCYTKRLGKDSDFVSSRSTTMNDKYFNGLSFQIPIYRGKGFDKYEGGEDPDKGLFRVGDTVIIKSVTMDKESFWFWSTIGSSGMGGSPAPANTNIRGGALGVWCGLGAHKHIFVCKNK